MGGLSARERLALRPLCLTRGMLDGLRHRSTANLVNPSNWTRPGRVRCDLPRPEGRRRESHLPSPTTGPGSESEDGPQSQVSRRGYGNPADSAQMSRTSFVGGLIPGTWSVARDSGRAR